ncbi:hypothetical protein EVAR_84911_1 [Eumeta japonica]|uniref:Uncharacterized protein n=1 Tax=Eumeta variegata TaxID=151549 RepID=A0A4C1Z344_EUMVA|nr:hypothetical protein EVAR_84911_1 [Eumeta japonica]
MRYSLATDGRTDSGVLLDSPKVLNSLLKRLDHPLRALASIWFSPPTTSHGPDKENCFSAHLTGSILTTKSSRCHDRPSYYCGYLQTSVNVSRLGVPLSDDKDQQYITKQLHKVCTFFVKVVELINFSRRATGAPAGAAAARGNHNFIRRGADARRGRRGGNFSNYVFVGTSRKQRVRDASTLKAPSMEIRNPRGVNGASLASWVENEK